MKHMGSTSTKVCSICGSDKPVTEFSKQPNTRDGLSHRCKDCFKDYYVKWYTKNKAKVRAKCRQWYLDNPERARENQKRHRNKVRANPDLLEVYRLKSRERSRLKRANDPSVALRAKEQNRALRLRVIEHYSAGKNCCECCGEGTIEFLSLDHINGGGGKHRKAVGPIYRWIAKNNFPDGFRVLCHNCNLSLGIYGYCPHKPKT